MQSDNDKELIKLVKSANQKDNNLAFKQFYARYFDLIQNIILKNNGSEKDAEDVFQDALIVFYHQVKKGKLDLTCSLKTYLYSICRNIWLKKLRSQKRVVQLSDTLKEYIPIEESILKTLEENEQKQQIRSLLDQLSPGCRDILLHFYFEKLKMSEIAKIMNLANEQVAKNKKAGCMKKLKALMGTSFFLKQH